MYKNELLPIQQKRSVAKIKRKLLLRKSCQLLFKKQKINKRKVKKLIQKLAKRRKTQN